MEKIPEQIVEEIEKGTLALTVDDLVFAYENGKNDQKHEVSIPR